MGKNITRDSHKADHFFSPVISLLLLLASVSPSKEESSIFLLVAIYQMNLTGQQKTKRARRASGLGWQLKSKNNNQEKMLKHQHRTHGGNRPHS
ncbi:MAG: hypothetical protein COY58_05370 [Gammaproteobacteria bacterium CG_4_10_14_0_8_um_filter_38_16]|nr:MAG: hypothetical protein COY58_05370 [Gammaproteobacteria bacterium CG_4_10_14_0_8_um_filter_38_16]PJA03994.1 MAG: hypothetical protein COX72_02295 [Gammaproteobacteria bacterium CG_4_10_14_0_2_um_filter_38_22]PJB09603.1 MAG: hypothetical protein CO120_09185 [Gammaproteobacteria bacterium CG_4_9_14_3_um_filter_38_9]